MIKKQLYELNECSIMNLNSGSSKEVYFEFSHFSTSKVHFERFAFLKH